MRSRFKMWMVSGVPGRDMTRTLTEGRISSSREMGYTSSKPETACPERLRPVIFAAPMPRRRCATLTPMFPVPSRVNALSRMERMGSWLDHPRSRTTASYSGIRRSSISVTITTCSAMVTP